jgi:hypothetical protein
MTYLTPEEWQARRHAAGHGTPGRPSPVRVESTEERLKLVTDRLKPAARRGRWICPSCGDGDWNKRPGHKGNPQGMSVDVGSNGSIMIHCFGCCSIVQDRWELIEVKREILAAIGLTFADISVPQIVLRAPGEGAGHGG